MDEFGDDQVEWYKLGSEIGADHLADMMWVKYKRADEPVPWGTVNAFNGRATRYPRHLPMTRDTDAWIRTYHQRGDRVLSLLEQQGVVASRLHRRSNPVYEHGALDESLVRGAIAMDKVLYAVSSGLLLRVVREASARHVQRSRVERAAKEAKGGDGDDTAGIGTAFAKFAQTTIRVAAFAANDWEHVMRRGSVRDTGRLIGKTIPRVLRDATERVSGWIGDLRQIKIGQTVTGLWRRTVSKFSGSEEGEVSHESKPMDTEEQTGYHTEWKPDVPLYSDGSLPPEQEAGESPMTSCGFTEDTMPTDPLLLAGITNCRLEDIGAGVDANGKRTMWGRPVLADGLADENPARAKLIESFKRAPFYHWMQSRNVHPQVFDTFSLSLIIFTHPHSPLSSDPRRRRAQHLLDRDARCQLDLAQWDDGLVDHMGRRRNERGLCR